MRKKDLEEGTEKIGLKEDALNRANNWRRNEANSSISANGTIPDKNLYYNRVGRRFFLIEDIFLCSHHDKEIFLTMELCCSLDM